MQRFYKLRPSLILSLLLSFMCLVLQVLLWQLPLPKSVLLVLTVVVLCWGGYCILHDANLRMGHSCVAFRLEGQDEIVLVLRSGRHMSGRVSPDSLVTPYLVILNVALSEPHGGRSLLILADAIGNDSLRRLRIALKWGGKSDQAAI